MSATISAPPRPFVEPSKTETDNVPSSPRRWWVSVLRGIPNLVVFALLAGVLYLGHRTEWKMPKVSELRGAAPEASDDWCTEHSVAETLCVECNADLFPKPQPFGFCREHGVTECVIDHPELAQVNGRPQLPVYDTAQAIALIARPENNSRNTLHTRRVQFASPETVDRAGIDVDVVQERPMSDFITANGELTFDPTRVAHLSTRVPGAVALVVKTLGDDVRAGDILALVDAAQVGQAKSQFLQAIVQLQLRQTTVKRLRGVADDGAVPKKLLTEAEAALQEAEIAFISTRQALANLGFELPDEFGSKEARQIAEELRYLDIPSSFVASLPSGAKTANLVPVRAPLEGIVVASEVVAGEVVDASDVLFTVADPRQMWLQLNVRQEDAKYVARGLPVRFRTDDGGDEIAGEVAWVSPAVEEHTRTLSVRVVVANPDGRLRDRTFGTGRIILREEPKAVVVPRQAVQSTSDAHFVFVRDKNYFHEDAPKLFHVRQVRIGAQDEEYVELLAGALPGEVIVTKGSPVLLAQLLRSSLGAGCGCHVH
jgi:cobalt-zinc-cadmium efflux system membrane fusion protein